MANPRPLKPHPLPPSDLYERPLPLTEGQSEWWHSFSEGETPLQFSNRTDHRFSAPEGDYGMLYLGSDAHGVFVETFDDPALSTVPISMLEQQRWCTVTTIRPLRLVDLTGSGLRTIGADARLCTGEYDITRAWGLALWHHPARVDGLYYLSRNDPSRRNVALFDRAASSLQVATVFRLQDHPSLLTTILETYRLDLRE